MQPKAASWETIRSHWLDTVCGGDQALFDYLEGWAATKVQNPASPPEVSLVMRGEEGAGKGVTWRRSYGCSAPMRCRSRILGI